MLPPHQRQSQDDISIKMGSRRKKRPSHIPLYSIENEDGGSVGGQLRQRPRANTGDSFSRRSRRRDVGDICDSMNKVNLNDAFITPPNQKMNDSGVVSDESPAIVHSDPDWFLRPRKLDVNHDTTKKKYPRMKFFSSPDESYWTKALRYVGLGSKRPNFSDTRSNRAKVNVRTETLLGSLIFIIVIASLCFSVLISMRFFETSHAGDLNGKYRSLEYASEQLAKYQLDDEVRLRKQSQNQDKVDHIPRDEDLDFVDEVAKEEVEETDFTDYEDPSTFRGNSKDKIEDTNEVETKNIKPKRTKNLNPLKPRKIVSAAKRKTMKEVVSKPVADSIANDYDDPPSHFRGSRQPEVIDLLNPL